MCDVCILRFIWHTYNGVTVACMVSVFLWCTCRAYNVMNVEDLQVNWSCYVSMYNMLIYKYTRMILCCVWSVLWCMYYQWLMWMSCIWMFGCGQKCVCRVLCDVCDVLCGVCDVLRGVCDVYIWWCMCCVIYVDELHLGVVLLFEEYRYHGMYVW